MRPFQYLLPMTLTEAVEMLAAHPDALPLAGGTDLVLDMKNGRRVETVMSLSKLTELAAIRSNGTLSVGATATMNQLASAPDVASRFAALAAGAAAVGSMQIRTRATVGGNLCNASPAADTAPPLLALGAEVTIAGSGGQRTASLHSFFVGPGETVLSPGELLISLTIPAPTEWSGSAYLAHTSRASMDTTVASVAAAITVDTDGIISAARVALGGVAPVPKRAPAAERLLIGRRSDADLLAETAAAAQDEATPIDDLRGSADFRRHLVGVLTRRALSLAIGRATADLPTGGAA